MSDIILLKHMLEPTRKKCIATSTMAATSCFIWIEMRI